jgi:transcription elongation factor Elf1
MTSQACFEIQERRFCPQKGERFQVPCKRCGFEYGVYKTINRNGSSGRMVCPQCGAHTQGSRGWYQQAMRWLGGEVK